MAEDGKYGFVRALLCAAAVFCFAANGHAALEISGKATSNVTCSPGVCTATAKKAILNVTDLANMLTAGDVAVKSGSIAQDIDIDAALSWTSTSRLTLDSYHSIYFKQPVTVAGVGGLAIATSDGADGGDFYFLGKGHVEFWDSDLVIAGF